MKRTELLAGGIFVCGLLLACPPQPLPSHQRPGGQPEAAPVAGERPAQPQGPQPKIEFSARELDAGTIQQGESIHHVFVVKNRGLGELNIEKVHGS